MAPFIAEENIEFTALCDVWKPNLERFSARMRELTGRAPRTFRRYQDLLARAGYRCGDGHHSGPRPHPDPDRRRRAGKDTFCEKPMSRTIEEARAAVEAVRSSDRIVQIGTQRRSDPIYMAGAEFIDSGSWAR